MNYLKNRYPFKLLTHFFTRTCTALQNFADIKRNKSDSALNVNNKNSQESLNVNKKSSISLAECQNIERRPSGHKLSSVDSNNSIPFSKTSSEHSFKGLLDRKQSYLSINNTEARFTKDLKKEFKFKLNQLQTSIESKDYVNESFRPKLKREYPWQNFNLDSISEVQLNQSKRAALGKLCQNNLTRCSSDQSMTTLRSSSSGHSVRSVITVSSTSSITKKSSKESLEDIRNQMPLFKSIIKKSAYKPVKEVTFNNISTIYGPSTSYSMIKKEKFNKQNKVPCECSLKKKDKPDTAKHPACFGRYQPLKEEHSFLHLYSGKNQKLFNKD